MSQTPYVAELIHVSKSFGAQEVLKNFDLRIAEKDHVAIMGRSGAGKTTILNLILGLIKPDSGEVRLAKDIRIGAVFQEDRLIEPLSAEGNIRLVSKRTASESRSLLNRLGLENELHIKPVSDLSGGEKRRVAIARAILCDPELLILDEPFKGIDQATLPSVISEVDAAAENKTLIIVTHTKYDAEALRAKIVNI